MVVVVNNIITTTDQEEEIMSIQLFTQNNTPTIIKIFIILAGIK